MNTIYSGCIPNPWLQVAQKLQKENAIEPVYWIAWTDYDVTIDIEKEIEKRFENCIFHDLSLAWKSIFPDSTKKIKPISLDGELLNSIAKYELIGIKMMDRLDPDRKSFPFEERQRHFRKLFSKWLGIIEKLNIELFISPSIPHRVFDYALYIACKIKGIETIMYKRPPFQDVLIPISDINSMPNNIIKTYNEIKGKRININLPNHIISSINVLKSYYDEAEPEYMKDQKRTRNFSYFKVLINKPLSVFKLHKLFKITKHHYKIRDKKMEEVFPLRYQSLLYNYKGRRFKRKLKQYYESLCSKIGADEKFIFVALHYQPEETTCPSASHYVNQNLIVENLAEVLPDDIKIVVKEHSSQFHPKMKGHTGRNKWFYDDLLKIPRVILASSDDPSFFYIDNSLAVATATGTIGWEAIVRGKPVLIFGNAWYEYCDNVFRTNSKVELSKAINKILSGNLESPDYLSYAKSIFKNGIQAYHYKRADLKSKISKNDSVNNLVRSISTFINNYE